MKLKYYEVVDSTVIERHSRLAAAKSAYAAIRRVKSFAAIEEITVTGEPHEIVEALGSAGGEHESRFARVQIRRCVRNEDGSYTETVRQ